MFKLKLNQEFNIDVEKYLLPETDTSMVPPLPEQPMPNRSNSAKSTTCVSNWVDYDRTGVIIRRGKNDETKR